MKPAARRKARRLALQALYQWHYTAPDTAELLNHFLPDINSNKTDVEYFKELVEGTINNIEEIDKILIPHLSRDIKAVNPVELAILRIACYELKWRPDVPYKVIINEALETCKVYGAEEGFKFINGVLDKIAKIK